MSKRAGWSLDPQGLATALTDWSAALTAYRQHLSGVSGTAIVEVAPKAADFLERTMIPALHFIAAAHAELDAQRALIEQWKAEAVRWVAPKED
jgi:hypothetical protein